MIYLCKVHCIVNLRESSDFEFMSIDFKSI